MHRLGRHCALQRPFSRRAGEFLHRSRLQHSLSHVNIGRHCRIRRAIIDRDVHIPEGTAIGFDPESDRQKYFVTDSGITVVTRDYSLFENPVTVDYFTSE
jgi:ADP-glucose pyrophosphorylase